MKYSTGGMEELSSYSYWVRKEVLLVFFRGRAGQLTA